MDVTEAGKLLYQSIIDLGYPVKLRNNPFVSEVKLETALTEQPHVVAAFLTVSTTDGKEWQGDYPLDATMVANAKDVRDLLEFSLTPQIWLTCESLSLSEPGNNHDLHHRHCHGDWYLRPCNHWRQHLLLPGM